MAAKRLEMNPDRLFDPDPAVRGLARELYEPNKDRPLVCPHTHVDPNLFSEPNASFGNPSEMIVTPDHYLTRMLYSHGIPLEDLGVPRTDCGKVERDPRKIWQTFADNYQLFAGTPTGYWLNHAFSEVFGVDVKLDGETATEIYDHIEGKLKSPEFSPRALYDRFGIEVLCTTDPAASDLGSHDAIRKYSGWHGNIRPTFRPDKVVNNVGTPEWRTSIMELGRASGIEIADYGSFVRALEQRRQYFRQMGATATDHAVLTPCTDEMHPGYLESIFKKALGVRVDDVSNDTRRFSAHMLMEMARMSCDDGLVMQLHPGSYRNHNPAVSERHGPDRGFDIPVQVDFTQGLKPLLDKYGNSKALTLVLFTLDEDTYSRELAPLTAYPAVKLGPPWWFHDSPNGIARYLERVAETAGFYNLAGFNDDTRAFPSIPGRHDVWRRCCANYLAQRVATGMMDMEDAGKAMEYLSYGAAKETYRL